MDAVPRFLVLMTAYNSSKWIGEQIDTVLSQVGVSVTIYISVDLSSDGTNLLVEKVCLQHENVHMLPYGQRYGGAGANFFRMIRDVSFDGYDYVAFSDHDDIWLSGKLLRAHKLFLLHGVDAVSGDVEAFWEDGRKRIIKKSYPQRKFDHFFESAGPGCTYVLNLNCAVSVRQFISSCSDFLLRIDLHDWLIYAFCRERGFSWYIDDRPMMLYRQHSLNQVGSNVGWRAYWKRFQLIRSHWYRRQVLAIAQVISLDFYENLNKRFFLLRHFWQFRRRIKDRLFVLFMIIFRVL